MCNGFEPEIEFPTDPYEAAFIYLALIAYPEKGAGEIGQAGSHFATALAQFSLWACSKARGLRYIREEKNDPGYVAPKKREFQGVFDRGMRRINRRIAAYELLGTQFLQGLFAVGALGSKAIAEGRAGEAYHMHPEGGPSPARKELWEQAMPSVRKVIGSAPLHWSDRLSLNLTGKPADNRQKIKDDYERAYLPSVPVLHMVHGFAECMHDIGPTINGWEEREPITAMLLNAELWIWKALELAESWRRIAPWFPGMSFQPSGMVALSWASGNNKKEPSDSQQAEEVVSPCGRTIP